jgi:putative intracellular protease/amidase
LALPAARRDSIRAIYDQKKVVAAICHRPWLLIATGTTLESRDLAQRADPRSVPRPNVHLLFRAALPQAVPPTAPAD